MDKKTVKNFLAATSAETLSVCDFDEKQLDNCIAFTLGELASLGAVFSTLPTAFHQLYKLQKGHGFCMKLRFLLWVSLLKQKTVAAF